MTTWMIVEDEPDLLDMLCELVNAIGHDTLAFANGEDALHWLTSVHDDHFDGEIPELALFDIRLPGQTNGPDLAHHLRQSPVLGQIVIVLMTAYRLSAAEETEIMQYATPDMLLYKPLPRFDEFRRRLEDLLM
jgi:CheY-like chemotaxis protein